MHAADVCPVCSTAGSCHSLTIDTHWGARLWLSCRACKSYCDTTPTNAHDAIAHHARSPSGQLQTASMLAEHRSRLFRSVLRILALHAPSKTNLLDVGCSYGGFLHHARKAGYAAAGMDIVPEAAAHVRQHGFDCQATASVANLDMPDGSLGVITVLDCSCYWPDPTHELRAIHRKLRPDGLLVMRVPDKSWVLQAGLILTRLCPGIGRYLCRRSVNDHVSSIPVRTVLRLLRDAGFQILYASPRGALYSDRSPLSVKTMFAVGYMIWRVTGRYLAPGCLILARKHQR
jgi:SAM-dependent methyltransferase